MNTRAAHVASANDPNRSAPIPAMSPTLSPTLSAIVAGFRGESSSNPSSTFPTKSAPTSAAFVYIPPPTLPNNATDDPPRPYAANSSINTAHELFCAGSFTGLKVPWKIRNKVRRIDSDNDIIEKPITQPAWNAVLKAPAREVIAL